jgi:hypothetical protein
MRALSLSLFKKAKNKEDKTTKEAKEVKELIQEEPQFSITHPTPRLQRRSSKLSTNQTEHVSTALKRASLRRVATGTTPTESRSTDDLLMPRLKLKKMASEDNCGDFLRKDPVEHVGKMVRRSRSGEFSGNINLVDLFRITIMEDREMHDQIVQVCIYYL